MTVPPTTTKVIDLASRRRARSNHPAEVRIAQALAAATDLVALDRELAIEAARKLAGMTTSLIAGLESSDEDVIQAAMGGVATSVDRLRQAGLATVG